MSYSLSYLSFTTTVVMKLGILCTFERDEKKRFLRLAESLKVIFVSFQVRI